MKNAPVMRTWVLALACAVSSALLAEGNDCVVHLQINVKKADGTVLPIQTVTATAHAVVPLMLAPGDSIMVDPNPNGYCSWNVHLIIRASGCGFTGDVVRDVLINSWNSPPITFLEPGDIQVTVEDADYAASACLLLTALSVGVQEDVPVVGFVPNYGEGILRLGQHPAGELAVFDVSGRMVWNARVATDEPSIALPLALLPGLHAVVLRTPQQTITGSMVVPR